jgi:hypothetical protein
MKMATRTTRTTPKPRTRDLRFLNIVKEIC